MLECTCQICTKITSHNLYIHSYNVEQKKQKTGIVNTRRRHSKSLKQATVNSQSVAYIHSSKS